MAEHYRFFDGKLDDERAYNAAEFAEYFRQFIRNGIFAGGENLQVSAPGEGMVTYVKPGYAWINGYMYKNDADLYLTHAPAHPTLPRIDRVVLRLDLSEDARHLRAFVLTGEPAEEPEPPEITREGDVYELALAQVLIEANVANINPANITDERFDTELCGLVTHLFEQVDTTEIFAQFTAEWQRWFGDVEEDTNEFFTQFTAEWHQFTAEWRRWFEEIKDVTNLVPRSEALLFMSIPQFQQAVQNPFFMEQMAQQFLALDVITSNPTAMDIIASSEVAMEAVAASEVAMEAVINNEMALSAVVNSEVAMEAVAASEVAMEAVVASEVVMEAVAASEVAMGAIFDSWLARLAIWESEMASQIIMQQARAWLEANVAEVAYRQSNSTEFAMVVDKKGLLLAIRHDAISTGPESGWNGEMRVFAQAPTARSYTDIVGGNLAANTWYDVAYRMENFQVKNRQSDGEQRRLDFRYVPMEP